MKKTIIALFAMCGVAMADTYTWDASKEYSFTWDDFAEATLGGNLTKAGYTVETNENGDSTLAKGSGTHQYWEVNTNSFLYDAISEATTTNATLTFTLDYYYKSSNWGQTIMHIGQDGKGISLGVAPSGWLSMVTGTGSDDAFTENKSTTQMAADSWNSITFTLSNNKWTTTLDGVTSSAKTLGAISWPTTTVGEGEDATTTLNMGEINKYSIGNKAPGYNTGANGILDSSSKIANLTISYTPAVPEPTTATLSLLALAGLAARRRRK